MESSSSIFNFKKLIRSFLLPILLVVIPVFFGINWLIESNLILNYKSSGAYKVNKILNEEDPNEIPIFGSSRANGSYIPDLIDSNCFNYGMVKTGIDYINLCLKNELSKNRETPIIINFDFNMFSTKLGNLANFIPNAGNEDVKNYLLNEYSFKMRIPLVKYFGHFDTYFKTVQAEKSNKHCLNKGCFILKDKFNPQNFQKAIDIRNSTNTVWTIDYRKDSIFRRLISNTNRPIIIAIAPQHESFYRNYINLNGANSYLEILSNLPNVSIFNEGEYSGNDDIFLDTIHVNYKGAKWFSKKLRAFLLSKGIIDRS